MQEFLDGVSENYSVILIDGPPVLPYVDAQLLCKSVDAVLFVVKSRCYKWTQVRDAIERIRETGKPVFGVALNSVSRLYRSSDY
jgi:Mrp family chromosome partitioning ATPase